MLEVNAQPVRDLRQLIEREGQPYVERQLNVHRTTILRWLHGTVRIPGAQVLAIRSLLGDLPGTAGAWTGWHFQRGKLTSPGGDQFAAGDVLATILLRQQLTAQRRELDALRLRVKVLETLTQESANDARLTG